MVKVIVLFFVTWIQLANSLYIRGSSDYLPHVNSSPSKAEAAVRKIDWEPYKRILGLSNEKVEILKHQKNQKATVDLINKFIKENEKYIQPEAAASNEQDARALFEMYHNLLKKYNFDKSSIKTSFNFVLGGRSQKRLKRHRRTIALNMVSDMPTEKIDDLIKMFVAQHNIEDKDEESEDLGDYTEELDNAEPSVDDKDYVYEQVYGDEEDLNVPAKSSSNSEFSSFQDLILAAARRKWQQELEETKLISGANDDDDYV